MRAVAKANLRITSRDAKFGVQSRSEAVKAARGRKQQVQALP